MKVLLDECVDWRLLRDLDEHDVRTVKQLGWEHVRNGELLRLAATQFDVFVTVDTNLPYQQNLDTLRIAVIILRGRTTRLPRAKPGAEFVSAPSRAAPCPLPPCPLPPAPCPQTFPPFFRFLRTAGPSLR